MAKSDETSERRTSISPNASEQNLDHGSHANCTLGWFLEQKHRYPPRNANLFFPYYSGEEVFTDLAHSIANAQKSVDLVLWGFDPAMPLIRTAPEYSPQLYSLVNKTNGIFVPRSGWRKEDAYGEIILKALRDNQNLKIRMVIWYNPVSHFNIKNIIGINTALQESVPTKSRTSIGFEPEDFSEEDLNKMMLAFRDSAAAKYSLEWFQKVRWEDFPERDRLAISFRNMANSEFVDGVLHSERIASLLQDWHDVQKSFQDFIQESVDAIARIAEEARTTKAYGFYKSLEDKVRRAGIFVYNKLNPLVEEIGDYIERSDAGQYVIGKIAELNELTEEYYQYVEAFVADYLSSTEAINYIEKLRNTKLDFLVKLANTLEVVEEDVNMLSNWSERTTLLFATDHQKVALIDYEDPKNRHGYVMGHNSTTGYWSRFPFVHRDVKNEMSGTPYHDFSIRVQGHLLIDLNHNFCEAWSKNRTSTLSSIQADGIPFPEGNEKASLSIVPSALENELAQDGELFNARKAYEDEILQKVIQGGKRGQIVRTRPDQKFDDGFQEKEVKDAYMQATRHANNYILIVNQYCQYPALIRHIKYWREERKKGNLSGKLYIFMGTCKPELDGQVFAAQQMANELGVGAQFIKGEDDLYNKDRADADGRREKTVGGAWAEAGEHVIAQDLEELDIKVLFFMFYTQIPEYELPQPAARDIISARDAVRPIYDVMGQVIGHYSSGVDVNALIEQYQAMGLKLYDATGQLIEPYLESAKGHAQALKARLLENEFISAKYTELSEKYNQGVERYNEYNTEAQPYVDEGIDIVSNSGERVVIPVAQRAADGIENTLERLDNYTEEVFEPYLNDPNVSSTEKQGSISDALKLEQYKIRAPWAGIDLAPGDKLPPDRIAQQPYVHAKLMLIDDMFFTLGSSNLNIRSMSIDSELNLISDDYTTAQNIRHKLFTDYSGEEFSEDKYPNRQYSYDQGVSAQQMQSDLELMHAKLTSIANDNARQVKKGVRIQGYIARFEDSRTATGMRMS